VLLQPNLCQSDVGQIKGGFEDGYGGLRKMENLRNCKDREGL
jgi:hypothetical protein